MDESERVEFERLKQRNELFERILHLLPQVVHVHDLASRTSGYYNRSLTASLGYSREDQERLGEYPLPALMHPSELGRLPELVAQMLSLKDGEVHSNEGRLRDSTGQWRWHRTNTLVFSREADGTPREVLGFVADVHEQRLLEQRLGHAVRLETLGQVAAAVAHDINNSLTAIMGGVGLIERVLGQENPASTYIALAEEAVDRAASLTRQILSFARPRVRNAESVDLGRLIASLEPMLRRLLPAPLALRLVLPEAPLFVRIAPSELEQVLLNLASNARDAMPDGGTVTISISQRTDPEARGYSDERGRAVVVTVQDTGAGIASQVLDRVFEPFFTTKTDGSGLGLASSRRVLESVGGTLRLESTPGQGTTATLWMPLAAPVVLAPLAKGVQSARLEGVTVLLLEGNAPVRRLLEETLTLAGARVLVSEAESRARELLAQRPSMLVLDPTQLNDPARFVEIARENQAELRCLFVCSIPPTLPERAHLLLKPFTPPQFLSAVQHCLASPSRHETPPKP